MTCRDLGCVVQVAAQLKQLEPKLITHTCCLQAHICHTLSLDVCSLQPDCVVQVAAQVKQLELKLIVLREEVAQKERQARQAEFTVRDLKLELENLQVIASSCNLVHCTNRSAQQVYCLGLGWPHCSLRSVM